MAVRWMNAAMHVGADQDLGRVDDLLQGRGQAAFQVQPVQGADAGGQLGSVDRHGQLPGAAGGLVARPQWAPSEQQAGGQLQARSRPERSTWVRLMPWSVAIHRGRLEEPHSRHGRGLTSAGSAHAAGAATPPGADRLVGSHTQVAVGGE
jgi:hypothetical protein